MGRPIRKHDEGAASSDDYRSDHNRRHFLSAVFTVPVRSLRGADHTGAAVCSIGGIIALYVSGEYLSVPASVGFIALWGIAVLNGVVLVSYIRSLRESGRAQLDAIIDGASLRFRPVMMTATVAALGLVPFLFATGPGSEVQRPLAVVVIGGLVTSTLLTLVVVPVLYRMFEGKADVPDRNMALQDEITA